MTQSATSRLAVNLVSLLALGAVCIFSLFALSFSDGTLTMRPRGLIDVEVYAGGARAFLENTGVYTQGFRTSEIQLDFTYPPFAALFFLPLALVPWSLLGELTVVINLLCTLWIAALLIPTLAQRARVPLLFIAATIAVSQPSIATFNYGQINLLLTALILTDLLVLTHKAGGKYSGFLVGMATAIKLTPGIFIFFFILKRQWRNAANVVIGFLLCTAAAAVLRFRDTLDYFGDAMLSTKRIGDTAYHQNLSLRGVTDRAGLSAVVWLIVVLAVTAVFFWLFIRIQRCTPPSLGRDLFLVSLVGLLGLLLSPVSWSHHWVWLPIALWAGWSLKFPYWLLSIGAVLCTVGAGHALFPQLGAWTSALYAVFSIVFIAISPLLKSINLRNT